MYTRAPPIAAAQYSCGGAVVAFFSSDLCDSVWFIFCDRGMGYYYSLFSILLFFYFPLATEIFGRLKTDVDLYLPMRRVTFVPVRGHDVCFRHCATCRKYVQVHVYIICAF